jgi:hypothetical protein
MSWCRALPWGPWPDFTFFFPLPKNCFVLRLGRPLWREDGSAICSAICQWLQSRRTHNRTLKSHLRLLGSLSVASYDSQGLRWKYSYPPPHGDIMILHPACVYIYIYLTCIVLVITVLHYMFRPAWPSSSVWDIFIFICLKESASVGFCFFFTSSHSVRF